MNQDNGHSFSWQNMLVTMSVLVGSLAINLMSRGKKENLLHSNCHIHIRTRATRSHVQCRGVIEMINTVIKCKIYLVMILYFCSIIHTLVVKIINLPYSHVSLLIFGPTDNVMVHADISNNN